AANAAGELRWSDALPLGHAAPALSASTGVPTWLAWAWAIGVLVMLARLVGGRWVLQSIGRQPAVALPAHWAARVDAMRRAMGIGRSVAVRLLSTIDLPFTARALRPVIWLPAAMLTRLAPEQIEALI